MLSAFRDLTRRDSVAYVGTCCQILNTILGGGAGICPLPFAMRLVGVKKGLSIMVISGILAAHTACSTVTAGCLLDNQAGSLQSIAGRALGSKAAIGVRVLLVTFAFGSGVAALTIFADVASVSFHRFSHSMCIGLATCLVGPIVVFVRNIERLAPISIVASALVLVYSIYAGWYFFKPSLLAAGWRAGEAAAEPETGTTAGLLQAISVINLSYNCHFNLLTLFNALPPNAIAPPREARRRQQRRMHMLICTAMVMSVLLYSSTAYWGYMTFGGTPSGNALADYATLGPCGSILNNALAASQLASLPLLIHEGVHESIALSAECLGARPVGERLHPTKQDSAHQDDDRQYLLRQETDKLLLPSRLPQACGAVWVLMMAIAATVAADTSRVLSVLSALCGGPLVSILPLLLLLRADNDMQPAVRLLNLALLLFSVTVTMTCSLSALGLRVAIF